MNEASSMSEQPTLPDLFSAISSVESLGGQKLSESDDGPLHEEFGRLVSPASHSVPPGNNLAKPTSDISGQSSENSSESSISSLTSQFQKLLESKLQAKLAGFGSVEYELTWKKWDMLSGVPICALRGSARRTFGKDSTGWPTPRAEDSESCGAHFGNPDTLTSASRLAPWPTPMAGSPGTENYNPAGNNDSSRKTVELVGWRTPTTGDAERGVEQNPKLRNPKVGTASLNNEAALAGWPTPNAIPVTRGGLQSNPEKALERVKGGHQSNLDDVACLSGWVTPSSRDWKDTPGMSVTGTNPDGSVRNRVDQLPRQAQLAGWPTPTDSMITEQDLAQAMTAGNGTSRKAYKDSGIVTTSSTAPTEKRGVFNPDHSRWLMGYQVEWLFAAPESSAAPRFKKRTGTTEQRLSEDSVTPLTLTSEPSSSQPT